MANVTGRPVAPARKLVAAVLGTIAVFVMVFGLGMSSWAVVALGGALLALSITLAMVNVARRGTRAWVAGHGQVKAVSDRPSSAAYGRAELQLLVVAPGLPVTDVLVRDPRVPVGKWPMVGDTVPLTVDVDDMRRVRIDWDQAADRGDDGDPPPPAAYEPADDYLDDDLLGEPEPPPWATPDGEWDRGPGAPPPPPPPADPDLPAGPIVVHETPGGPVLEGQLVHQEETTPLPRRARSATTSDFPPAAGPAAAADFAAAPPSSAYPSAADDSPFARRSSTATDGVSAPPRTAYPSAAEESPFAPGPSPDPEPYPPPGRASAAPPPPSPDGGASAATVPGRTGPRRSKPRPRPHPTGAATASAGTTTATVHPSGTATDSQDASPRPTEAPTNPVPGQRAKPPTAGPPSAGPATAGPATAGPATTGPATADPATTGPATAASSNAGHATAGPAGAGPSAAGPATAGPSSAGSTISGPTSDDFPEDKLSTDEPAAPEASADQAVGPAAASTLPEARDPEIDLPLDGDPEPAPEFTPQARPAVDNGIIAPPADRTAAADVAGAPTPESPPPLTDLDADAAARASQPPTISGMDIPVEFSDASPPGAPASFTADNATAGTRDETAQPNATEAGQYPHGDHVFDVVVLDEQDRSSDERRRWADLEGGYEPDERADDLITAYPSARPGAAGAIHGVGITVLVTDLARSVAFYRDVLGFFEIDSGSGSAVLASGDTRLVLRTVRSLSSDIGRLISLNLEVGDLDAVHEELKAKGVKFEHGPRPVNRGGKLELWSATFHDPDGHNIAITQWHGVG